MPRAVHHGVGEPGVLESRPQFQYQRNSRRKKDTAIQRILVVTRNYPPLVGGMERLVFRACEELGSEYEIYLLGPEGCEGHANVARGVWACPLNPLPRFLACLQWKASRIALRYKPDLVLAGSGLAAPAARVAASLRRVPALCYLHGLDLVAPSWVYRRAFLPMIRACDVLIANSHNTARLIEARVGRRSGVRVLHPGVEMPTIEDVGPKNPASFRQSLGLGARPLLLSVGRLSARKGLAEFIEHVLPAVVRSRPDVALAVVGDVPRRALVATGDEAERIQAAIDRAAMRSHVFMLGMASDEVLRRAYRESDLLVFPARELAGDVEGFGMVALEAAAHGLPTIAFAVGGIPDAVAQDVSGYLVAPDDYGAFARTVLRHLEGEDRGGWHTRCVGFAQGFTWAQFGTRLRRICGETLERSLPGRQPL